MKLSCLPVSLFPDISSGKMTIKEYARLCKDMDLDGFDLGIILLKNHTPTYIKQFRKDCDEVGITPAMITTYPDFTHPDPVQREREFEYLRHDIALASNVGARFLRIATSIGDRLREVGKIFHRAGYLHENPEHFHGRKLGEIVARAMMRLSEEIGFPTTLKAVPGYTKTHKLKCLEAAKNPKNESKLKNMGCSRKIR